MFGDVWSGTVLLEVLEIDLERAMYDYWNAIIGRLVGASICTWWLRVPSVLHLEKLDHGLVQTFLDFCFGLAQLGLHAVHVI